MAKTDPYEPIDQERLNAARLRAGLSWHDLAARLKPSTSHQRLTAICNTPKDKRRRCRGSLLRSLAESLRVDAAYLKGTQQFPSMLDALRADEAELERELPVAHAHATLPARASLALSDFDGVIDAALERDFPKRTRVELRSALRSLVFASPWRRLLTGADAVPSEQGEETFPDEEAFLATIVAVCAWLEPWLEGRATLNHGALQQLQRLMKRQTRRTPSPARGAGQDRRKTRRSHRGPPPKLGSNAP